MNPAFECDRNLEEKLDAELARIFPFKDATEVVLNPLLPMTFSLAASYARSFPQHAFIVDNGMTPEPYLMSPTCCYPLFSHLSGRTLPATSLYTHKNICFRCEHAYQSGARQGAFLMREYILLAERLETVREWIDDVSICVGDLLSDLGLHAKLQKATDPFFDPRDLRQKFQVEQNLKSEFVVGDLAVASINLHLQAMSRNCNILSAAGSPLYSACFGLGYDRMAHKLAMVSEPEYAH